jgi:hypothetical protein
MDEDRYAIVYHDGEIGSWQNRELSDVFVNGLRHARNLNDRPAYRLRIRLRKSAGCKP